MIRIILFYALLCPVTIFFSLMAIIFARFDKSGAIGNQAGVLWGRVLTYLSGVRVEADLAALTPGRNYVFMANHQSFMDIPIVFSALRDYNIRFVAKESLFSIPFFGPAMRWAGHVAINRENRRKAMQSIDEAVVKARNGVSIVIFPEGTRSSDYSRLDEFKIGGVILALKCEKPVVPLILIGSGEVLPRNSRLIRPGTVSLKALAPIDAASRYSLKEREAFKNDLHTLMNSTYLELRT